MRVVVKRTALVWCGVVWCVCCAGCSVHVLRSVAEWSLGVPGESSIHKAYTAAIESAQHYVYIENQFFISSLAGSGIKNGVAKAILERLRRAIYAKYGSRAAVPSRRML